VENTETVLISLLVAVTALSAAARRLGVPYPIVMVLGGTALGFVPGLPRPVLDPDLVLVLFLPPLLYSSAFFVSLRDLRADMRTISLLAVGLVLATMVAVALTVHAVVDGLPWAAAFTLGAIVAPTDPIAATAVAGRIGLPRRAVNILEGEGLLNDASALVAYRVAVAAVGGSFSLLEAGGRFFLSAAGGVAVGLAAGWLIAQARRRIADPQLETTVSLLSGFAGYLPAERLGCSGVLAAVTVGVYVGWQAPRISSPTQRLRGFAVWEQLTFLLNALLFTLVGLQLPGILDRLSGVTWQTLAAEGALVSLVVIGTRMVWGHTVVWIIRALDRRASQRARRANWRARTIIAWAGMRGAVSLAAALALPTDFPHRDRLIFLTYAVILTTLVLQGLTLPLLARVLALEPDDAESREELLARKLATRAALARLDELSEEDWTRNDTVDRMRGLYRYRETRLSARASEDDDGSLEHRSRKYQHMVRAVLQAQRSAVLELRDQGRISNEVMHRIERELDLEDERLEI
jgi:CPA1 family monovalent cation:H+ antiporter